MMVYISDPMGPKVFFPWRGVGEEGSSTQHTENSFDIYLDKVLLIYQYVPNTMRLLVLYIQVMQVTFGLDFAWIKKLNPIFWIKENNFIFILGL